MWAAGGLRSQLQCGAPTLQLASCTGWLMSGGLVALLLQKRETKPSLVPPRLTTGGGINARRREGDERKYYYWKDVQKCTQVDSSGRVIVRVHVGAAVKHGSSPSLTASRCRPLSTTGRYCRRWQPRWKQFRCECGREVRWSPPSRPGGRDLHFAVDAHPCSTQAHPKYLHAVTSALHDTMPPVSAACDALCCMQDAMHAAAASECALP